MSAQVQHPAKQMTRKGRHIGLAVVNRILLILFCAIMLVNLLACNHPVPAPAKPGQTPAEETPAETQVDANPVSDVSMPTPFPAASDTAEIPATDLPTLPASPGMIIELSTQTPSPLPVATNTPVASNVATSSIRPPLPAILFEAPGPLSKIASPIYLKASVIPGEGGKVYIQVTGEDGRSIHNGVLDFSDNPYRRTYFTRKIDFTIAPVAETARITLSTKDYYGRLVSLSSVDVILLRLGDDLGNPPSITEEPYIIQTPVRYQTVSGGMVLVTGWLRPVNTSPLILDLVDTKGVVVASQAMPVTLVDSQQAYTPFTVGIPYSVLSETRVRLTVHQDSDNRLPGVIALNSLELVIRP